MSAWSLQSASDGLGEWLVDSCPGPEVWVIAPPGVALASDSDIAGWRIGCWRESERHSISLDADRPWPVSAISTREVLDLLPSEHHQYVLDTLLSQLAVAHKVAVPLPGEAIVEDLARIGAQATAWARAELAEAFPQIEPGAMDLGDPFPLGSLAEPPTPPQDAPALPAAASERRRPQPLAQFIADWVRWLVERHLLAVSGVTHRRRRRLLARRGDHAHVCGTAGERHDPDPCRQGDTGEYVLR